MYYVIQTAPNKESEVELYIERILDGELYTKYFHPIRVIPKKIRGEWVNRYEKLFPGYVFLITDRIEEIYLALKKIPAMTKLLGKENDRYYPLTPEEEEWLNRLLDISEKASFERFDAEVAISNVEFDENDNVVIKDGPLKNMEGYIKKINLHKKIAEVEVDFMNNKTVIYLGIEFLKKR